MNNIYMLRHSKIVMLSLHNWVFLLSLSLICPCMICSRKKYMQIKSKAKKKNQNAFKYGCKRVSRRYENYRMYLKSDSPHQAVMIVCEWNWFSHISNLHNMRHMHSCYVFTHITQILYYFWYICRCNMIWPSQGIHVLIYAN